MKQNDRIHVGNGHSCEARLRVTDLLFATWTDDVVREQWSERESRRIVEKDLRRVNASRTELSKLEFRRLADFIFADFPKLRRQALLSGEITMGDGRIVRRLGHVELRRAA